MCTFISDILCYSEDKQQLPPDSCRSSSRHRFSDDSRNETENRSELFYTLFRELADPVLIWKVGDGDTLSFVEANEAAESLWSFTSGSLGEKSEVSSVLETIRLETEGVFKQVRMGNPGLFEWTHQSATGRIVCYETCLSFCRYRGAEYVITDIRDITHRKQFEEDLKAKNRELDEFAYMVSHDLKAPLTTIGWQIDLMREESYVDEPGLRIISEQAEKLSQLIEGLLHLSRAGRVISNIGRIDLHDLINEVFYTCCLNREPVSLSIPSSLPEIRGDYRRIEQVFINLLRNAIVCRDPEKDSCLIEVTAEEIGDKVIFCISDNGIGIPPDLLNRIFVPSFTTRKGEGTGFGLSISRKIIEAHGGRIWAESAGEGNGASFYVQLPRA